MNLQSDEILYSFIGLFTLFNFLMVVTLSLVWLERKFLGRLQGRVGPTRVGPFGLLQAVADALKLLLKEDVSPGPSAKLLFFCAPILVFVPGFMVWLAIPFSENLVVRDLSLGVFFFVAFSVLSIVGLVLAGWASASKYAVLGGFRSAAQLVSYEIPIIMSIIAVVILSRSLNFVEIVNAQTTIPYGALLPLGLVIFLISGVAEVGRTPFDIYFAESEVVGGPFVEYSGAHWAVFFLAEYINTFVIAMLTALLFLGGWIWPFGNLPLIPSVLLLLGKTYAVVLVIFWLRATYPRLRIDQLMSIAWKFLIPLSFVAVIIASFQQFYSWPVWSLTVMSLIGLVVPIYIQLRVQRKPAMDAAKRYSQRAILHVGVKRNIDTKIDELG